MIEIKGFLENSFVDWQGKICSVLFLPHCNFRCPYCHNHPLLFHPDRFVSLSLPLILERLSSLRGWVDGVCITGGEPTLQADLPSLARELKKAGLQVKLDTNGSNPELLQELIEAEKIDFVSMDVKAPLDPIDYGRAAGVPVDLRLIWRSIDILKKGGVEYEFRMTIVPSLHREEDIRSLSQQLKVGKRFILQSFNPDNPLDPSLKSILPYETKALKRLEREIQGATS
jgi:pyruvate formate lyase activating enzyme